MSNKKKFTFTKIAFVLGGCGLIGLEISKKLKKKGVKVIILDIKKKIKNVSDEIIYEKFDFTKIKNVNLNLVKLCSKYGIPDIFVNAAYPRSISWKNASFDNIRFETLKENVNLQMNSSAWIAIKIANLMKKKKKSGSIIFLNSIYGVLGQDLNVYKGTELKSNAIYSLIKGGLNIFAKNMASFYGEFGIRINSVISGGVKGHIAGSKFKQSKKFINNFSKKTFLKKMAKPEQIANGVIFLAMEDSSYITGSNLIIDAGWSAA